MGNLRHLWMGPFLAALRETGVITYAAAAVPIDRSTVTRARQEDKEFAAAVLDALEEATDKLELEARRRAVNGVRRDIYYRGEVVGEEFQFSDQLLALLLKGRRKDVFGERMELTGADGGPIKSEQGDDAGRAARVSALIELARRRRDAERFG